MYVEYLICPMKAAAGCGCTADGTDKELNCDVCASTEGKDVTTVPLKEFSILKQTSQ